MGAALESARTSSPVATTDWPKAGALQQSCESSPAQKKPSRASSSGAPPSTSCPRVRLQHPRPLEPKHPARVVDPWPTPRRPRTEIRWPALFEAEDNTSDQ